MTKKHDAFTGRESACPKSAKTPLAAIHGGREKAPRPVQGEGAGLNTTNNINIAVILAHLAQEVRFSLVFGVLLYCTGGLLA